VSYQRRVMVRRARPTDRPSQYRLDHPHLCALPANLRPASFVAAAGASDMVYMPGWRAGLSGGALARSGSKTGQQ